MHPQTWCKGLVGHYEGNVCMSHLLVVALGRWPREHSFVQHVHEARRLTHITLFFNDRT